LSVAEQVSVLYAANEGLLDDIDNKEIQNFKVEWFKYFNANMKDLIQKLDEGAALSDEDKKALTDNILTFKKTL